MYNIEGADARPAERNDAHLPTCPIPPLTAVGVDPGFAKTGIAGVAKVDGRYVSRGVLFVETKREAGRSIKAGMDDARRTWEMWRAMTDAIQLLQPHVVGIEAYSVRTPRGVDDLKAAATKVVQIGVPPDRAAFAERLRSDDRYARRWVEGIGEIGKVLADGEAFGGIGLGNAAKTIIVWGIAMGCAYAAGVPVYVFTATDLHKRLTGSAGSSKEDIGRALETRVDGLAGDAERIAPSKRNHVHDAAGHAVLALDELARYARALGIRQ